MADRADRTPRISFVLVEPRYEGNIGACCRALKNNGFRNLRLVRPPELGGEAHAMAWKSLDVLNSARRFETLDDAIADARLVAAFSSRLRRDTRDVLTLDDAIPRLLEAEQDGRVALLFGREDRGLTREEMAPSSFLVNIPAARIRQVYNLSQAVLLAAYAIRQAWLKKPAERPGSARGGKRLTAKEHRHLQQRIRDSLVALGYREHADSGLLERIVTRLGRIFDRADIDRSDQAMLLGMLKRVERAGNERRPRSS